MKEEGIFISHDIIKEKILGKDVADLLRVDSCDTLGILCDCSSDQLSFSLSPHNFLVWW